MDSYRSVMDILGWNLQLLVNAAFVQTVLRDHRRKGEPSPQVHL